MKKLNQLKMILVASIVFIILIAGCEKQNMTSTKKGRLLAAENQRIIKQLKKRDANIAKQKKLLEQCREEKQALKEVPQINIDGILESFLQNLGVENERLTDENERLNAEVERLKK